MNLKARVGRLAIAQQRTRFKIIASIVIAVVAIASYATWLVVVNAPSESLPQGIAAQSLGQPDASAEADPNAVTDDQARTIQTSDADDLRQLIGSRDATLAVGLGTLTLTALALVVTWLGLALTYSALLLAAGAIVAPLLAFTTTQSYGVLLLGIVVLCAAFAASLEALRLVLSPTHPLTAVARNVLNEAVRMKIGIVFIIALITLLATMPLILTSDSPLRFRVQSFLKYSSIATFWTLALLTLFFSCATVAFEQRDHTIWSTVCKPITSLQYILGKWLGVMAVNAALLAVAAAGIFFFTEYLRRQPAQGEIAPFVNATGSAVPTNDRLLLESHVLIAREERQPITPPLDPLVLRQAVDERVSQSLQRNPDANLPKLRTKIIKDVMEAYIMTTRNIEAADELGYRQREYTFENLQYAKRVGKPITLRYTIHAGYNSPTELYRIVFLVQGVPIVRETPLNVAQTITLRPEVIQDDGTLVIGVINGDPTSGRFNPFSFRFPPGDLQVLYTAGGYELNFVRIFAAMFLKLGFLASVGVFAASSLSFPVACFLAALVLFAAETAGFLNEGIDIYVGMAEKKEEFVTIRKTIAAIATPVAWMFTAYDNIKPGESLVQGRLLSWGTLANGFAIITSWAVAVLLASWQVFRRRELAIYSGH